LAAQRAAYATSESVWLSVLLSATLVNHTKRLRYRNVDGRDVSSFFRPNFLIANLGVHPERVQREAAPLNGTN